jgi:hypothetical protein
MSPDASNKIEKYFYCCIPSNGATLLPVTLAILAQLDEIRH